MFDFGCVGQRQFPGAEGGFAQHGAPTAGITATGADDAVDGVGGTTDRAIAALCGEVEMLDGDFKGGVVGADEVENYMLKP